MRRQIIKKLIIVGAFSSLAVCMTACGLIPTGKPTIYVEHTDDPVEEDASTDVGDAEPATTADTATDAIATEDWCSYEVTEDEITITMLKGIPDDYMISDKGTFKDLCDWLNYGAIGYNTETFRSVLSTFFAKEEYYREMRDQAAEDDQLNVLTTLASLAWTISGDGSKVKSVHLFATDVNTYIFHLESPSAGAYKLAWNTATNELFIINESEKWIPYDTDTFSEDTLRPLALMVASARLGDPVPED